MHSVMLRKIRQENKQVSAIDDSLSESEEKRRCCTLMTSLLRVCSLALCDNQMDQGLVFRHRLLCLTPLVTLICALLHPNGLGLPFKVYDADNLVHALGHRASSW